MIPAATDGKMHPPALSNSQETNRPIKSRSLSLRLETVSLEFNLLLEISYAIE